MELTAAAIAFRTAVLPLHRSRGRGDAGGRFSGGSNVGICYTRVLMRQQEGLKRKLKEKKDTLDKSKVIGDFESSSSSSSSFESSDSERKEESNKNWFRSRAMTHSQEAAASAKSVMQRENSGSSDGELSCSNGCKDDEIETIVEGPTTKTIEVCMGGKDRKLGGAESENLEEAWCRC
ncbi:hypothetical protein SLEP1_g4473 [Rubroshorea leprosula]|uniref:Uncharacterized protein n=1 Tax=Rubroshorea leprosula TaxID=152421 RepID=A0AAV5HWY2_9ROSI|nr:hypothetical protein SLEP1_g4473 [Rubroshorea leprosula]